MSKGLTKSAAGKSVGDEEDAKLVDIIDRARTSFAEQSLRFTDLREQVFTEIASTRGSIGAYEILERLAEKGTRLAPISVYRSIDALMEAGVIHRLESKNAFFACRRHEHGGRGRPIFLSCEKCGCVTEVSAQPIFDKINELSSGAGFHAKVKFVEVSGLCSACEAKVEKRG